MTATARLRVGEIEIAYDEAGQGGRPFVLVHGFTGSRDDWHDVLDDLGALGRTLAPDQRGHGDSTNTGDAAGYTLERLVADLEGFLDGLGVTRCDLLGHSMGGMVALRFVLAHPGRVSSLVLMDTAASPLTSMPRILREAGVKIVREQGMETLYQILRANMIGDPRLAPSMRRVLDEAGHDAFFERMRRKMVAMDPEAFTTLVELIAEHESVEDRLGEIRCATTVIVGAEDTPFLAPSQRMADGIPGARHVVIADAAHSPQIENRAAWLTAISTHLAAARAA